MQLFRGNCGDARHRLDPEESARLTAPELGVEAVLAQDVEILDLSATTHDPLLANLRQRLRKFHAAPRQGEMGVTCVFSREPVTRPEGVQACDLDGNLNCHGYGSSVAVTAGFGMVAAAELVKRYLKALARAQKSVL